MEAGIISEVETNQSQTENLEAEKLQELVDVLDMQLPEEAEALREEITILERLQEEEEREAIIEVFDDSSSSSWSSKTHTTTVATAKKITAKEMAELGFPESMIQTVMRNLDELKNKVQYSIGNMEMFSELNELEFDPEVIEEVMGNLSARIDTLNV